MRRDARNHEVSALTKEKEKLERTREKLLKAHYADAIPLDLLRTEQDRITTALTHVSERLKQHEVGDEQIENHLANALNLLQIASLGYAAAPEHIKRQLNQALLHQVFVYRDDDEPSGIRVELEMREPFSHLVNAAGHGNMAKPAPESGLSPDAAPVEPDCSFGAVSSHDVLVPPTGIEPATFGTGNQRSIP